MKNITITIFSFLSILFLTCTPKKNEMSDVIDLGLKRAKVQAKAMSQSLLDKKDKLPRTIDKDGEILLVEASDWTSGFFPGELWYLYEVTKDEAIREYAEEFTMRLEKEQYTTDNHDIGFMIYNSFGNGYRLTKNKEYEKVIIQAAKSLATRYRSHIGIIRSWDFNQSEWQYPVIIDNMMNLELLLWVTKKTNDNSLREIAINHANTTMKNHFRSDFSSFHVVSYDTITGIPHKKQTSQGYADSSAWARGQGWALYGYTMMYRETKDPVYLRQAEGIAQFIMNHPNLPPDKIPYWDFNAPDIPYAHRDASAGALMASAFIELSRLTKGELSKQYLEIAETQLKTLTSDEYLARQGTNCNFLLKHSVGHKPVNNELDKPLIYTDYYYVEALLRYKKWILKAL